MKAPIISVLGLCACLASAQDISLGAAPISDTTLSGGTSVGTIDQPSAQVTSALLGPTPPEGPVGPDGPAGPSWPQGPSWPSGPTWPVAPKAPVGPVQLHPLLAHLPQQPLQATDPHSPFSPLPPADPQRPSYWLTQAIAPQGTVASTGNDATSTPMHKAAGVTGVRIAESLQHISMTVNGLFNVASSR